MKRAAVPHTGNADNARRACAFARARAGHDQHVARAATAGCWDGVRRIVFCRGRFHAARILATDEPNAACAATTDFGLRREAETPRRFWKQPVVRKAVSPLRSATAIQIFARRSSRRDPMKAEATCRGEVKHEDGSEGGKRHENGVEGKSRLAAYSHFRPLPYDGHICGSCKSVNLIIWADN